MEITIATLDCASLVINYRVSLYIQSSKLPANPSIKPINSTYSLHLCMQGDLIHKFIPKCSMCQSISKLYLTCNLGVSWFFFCLFALFFVSVGGLYQLSQIAMPFLSSRGFLSICTKMRCYESWLITQLSWTEHCVHEANSSGSIFNWLLCPLYRNHIFIMLMVYPGKWKHRWFLWNIWISGPMAFAKLKFNELAFLLVRLIQCGIYY